MDAAHRNGTTGITLATLSVLAASAGVVAGIFMTRQHDPPGTHPQKLRLREVATPFTHRASRRLIAFHVAWHASVGITASLCAITMLEALRIGFAGMAIYNAGVACVRLLATRIWGRTLDRVGSRPVLVVCSFGLALSSLLWLLAGEGRIWPIALDAALSGALLSGHELAAFAAPLRVAPRVARPLHLAAFAMASGLSFGIASIAGGTMTEFLPTLSVALGTRALFVVSCCGRIIAGILALRILEPGAQPVARLSRLFRGLRQRPLAAPSAQ
jgi:MFS family permease